MRFCFFEARLDRDSCLPGSVLRQETRGFAGYEGFTQAQTMSEFPPATHDVFALDELLTEEEKDIKYRTRAFMVLSSQLSVVLVMPFMHTF